MKHDSIVKLLIMTLICLKIGLNAQSEEKKSELPQSADISVNGITLQHQESLLQILGNDLQPIEGEYGFSSLTVYNRDKTQCLTLIFYPGEEQYHVSEFSLKYCSPEMSADVRHVLQENVFLTGKQISLGMSKTRVLSILGNIFQGETNQETTTMTYRLTSHEAAQFLAQYHMPAYYGRYIFQADQLISFVFGFEYP